MVNTKHKHYDKFLKKWEKTRDCIDGQDAVKEKTTRYLPKLSGHDDNEYSAYLQRATFVEFTKRAMVSGIGQIFRKPPVVSGFEDYQDNIDLAGRSFDYFSREAASEIMQTNHSGIFLDYSEKQRRPYLTLYKAESIINWYTEIINDVEKLSLVVIEGTRDIIQEDKFTIKEQKVWKVLFLDDGVYRVEIYVQRDGDIPKEPEEIRMPEFQGSTMDFIPFWFVTSNGTTWELINPVLLSMANLNLGQYRNYADYENMLHYTGVKSTVSKGWEDGKSFPLGDNIILPPDGDCYFLEASSDSGLKDEIQSKTEKMAALSSAFLSGSGRYVASAETAKITSEGEFASLSDISNSLSTSFSQIMTVFMEWLGSKEEVSVSFNTDFVLEEINPGLLTALMGAVGAGLMSFETFFYNMKNKEMYKPNWTVDDELEQIELDFEKKVKKQDKVISNEFQSSTESGEGNDGEADREDDDENA